MNFIGKRGLARLLLACVFATPILSLSAQESRIAGPIETSNTLVLKGNRNPRAVAANDQGPLDPFTRIPYMRVTLKPTAQQTADLEALLEAQRDPSSSDYHRWLTPEEFGERFGASQNDIEKLRAWLESTGFTVEQTARARNWIAFSGTAGQIERTFRTAIHHYESAGEAHFANAAEPSIPVALAALVGELIWSDLVKSHADPALCFFRRGKGSPCDPAGAAHRIVVRPERRAAGKGAPGFGAA